MQRILGCCAQVTAWDAGGNWLDQGKILDRPPLFWHGHKTFPVGLNFQGARQLFRKKLFHWIENHFSGKINTCYPCVRTGMKSRDLQGKRGQKYLFPQHKLCHHGGHGEEHFYMLLLTPWIAFVVISPLCPQHLLRHEISVKIVSSRETGLNCPQTASEDLGIKQLILNFILKGF